MSYCNIEIYTCVYYNNKLNDVRQRWHNADADQNPDNGNDNGVLWGVWTDYFSARCVWSYCAVLSVFNICVYDD